MKTVGIIAIGLAGSLAIGCDRSNRSAPDTGDETPAPQATAAEVLSFGVEGMRRQNGAL